MEYLCERGVQYSTTKQSDLDWKFKYRVIYRPTGQVFERTIYIADLKLSMAELGFYKLLDHWNKGTDWQYHSIL